MGKKGLASIFGWLILKGNPSREKKRGNKGRHWATEFKFILMRNPCLPPHLGHGTILLDPEPMNLSLMSVVPFMRLRFGPCGLAFPANRTQNFATPEAGQERINIFPVVIGSLQNQQGNTKMNDFGELQRCSSFFTDRNYRRSRKEGSPG